MPPEKQKKEPRLTNGTIGLMFGFALFFDILEALIGLVPIIGWGVNIVLDVLVFAILWIWFVRHKVNFTKNRALVFIGLGLLKFIPVIEEFPLWIMDVIAVSTMVRMEDKLNLKFTKENITGAVGKNITRKLSTVAKNPLVTRLLNNQRDWKGQVEEKPKETRKQIIDKQVQLNEEKKARIASNSKIETKKETPVKLPEIGTNTKNS
ncbi:MAG: hypothetical protein WCF92_01605 [bacterium]